jgi:putative peptide zinc metalloprotease protein
VSEVEGISQKVLKESPAHLSSQNGGELPTHVTPTGAVEPISPVFEGIAPLPVNDPHGMLKIGLVGRAKISTEPRTIAARLWRYFQRTFNFEL